MNLDQKTVSIQQRTKSKQITLDARFALRVVACICLLVFAFLGWLTQSFPTPFNSVDVGPGRVPFTASLIGIMCSITLIYFPGKKGEQTEVYRSWWVALGALVLSAYVLVMPYVGFYLSSAVAIPLLMLAGGERRWLVLLLSAAGFLTFVYCCFELLLGVQFP